MPERDETIVSRFRVVRRRQYWISYGGFLLSFVLAFGGGGLLKRAGFDITAAGAMAVAAALLGVVVFVSLRNWRCPSCKGWLGKQTLTPGSCPACGIPLR